MSLCPGYRKCQKVLGKNMDLWENEVYRFKTIGQLKVSYSDSLHTLKKKKNLAQEFAIDLERDVHVACVHYLNVIIRGVLVSCVGK